MVAGGGRDAGLIGLTGRNMAPARAGDGRNGTDCLPGKIGRLMLLRGRSLGPRTPGLLRPELVSTGTRDPGSLNPGFKEPVPLIPGFLTLGSWNKGDTFGNRLAEGRFEGA